jgi:hypothetical protein
MSITKQDLLPTWYPSVGRYDVNTGAPNMPFGFVSSVHHHQIPKIIYLRLAPHELTVIKI